MVFGIESYSLFAALFVATSERDQEQHTGTQTDQSKRVKHKVTDC